MTIGEQFVDVKSVPSAKSWESVVLMPSINDKDKGHTEEEPSDGLWQWIKTEKSTIPNAYAG